MSLTFPAAYSTATKRPFKENWLFQLYYDASNFVGVAFSNTTVDSVFYEGAVLSRPTIRDSINLARSTASTGNIGFSVANFNYGGSGFSQEIFGGANKYLNHNVKIYSQLDDESSLSNCLQIYQGRLVGVKHNEDTINFQVVAQKPWDKLELPNTKTTTGKIWIPVSYGNFTTNAATTWASPQFAAVLTSKAYRPVPLDYTKNNSFWAVNGEQSEASSALMAFYDENMDIFIPFAAGDTASTTEDGAELISTPVDQLRSLKIRPNSSSTTSTSGIITKANLSRMYNTDDTDFGSFDVEMILTNNEVAHIEQLNIKSMVGDWSRGTLYLKYELVVDILVGDMSQVQIQLTTNNGSIDITKTTGQSTTTASSPISAYDGSLTLTVTFTADDSSGLGTLDATLKIYDIYVKTEMKTADYKPPVLLTAGDGLTKSYTGGASGAIIEIHEAHRDILNRFAGWDDSDANIDGWSALDTARNGWNLRWWRLEPILVQKALELLQYEGCFIFRYRPDGTGKYIHIANAPSADHNLTSDDYTNLSVELTPFSELITKQEISYEKNPAANRYFSTATHNNPTARTDWNIDTKENIKPIKLDALVTKVTTGSNPNDSFSVYYDNIFGTIKLMATMTIVNPVFYNMEVGDICNFSSMSVSPFGDSWSGKDFMITKLKRSPGSLRIAVREI